MKVNCYGPCCGDRKAFGFGIDILYKFHGLTLFLCLGFWVVEIIFKKPLLTVKDVRRVFEKRRKK